MKHLMLAVLMAASATALGLSGGYGCNTITTNTTDVVDEADDSGETGTPAGDTTAADLNHPAGNTAVVLGTDFMVGSFDLISLDNREITQDVTTAHSDGAVFGFDNKLYVVNRLGADNIQVIDPANGFATTLQCSVGQGTNPQQIIVVSPTKAYVTLYQPDDNGSADLTVDDVLIVNPSAASDCSDFITGSIDLTPYTAEDDTRLARASSMVAVSGTLYVVLQDLPAGWASPDQPGKIITIGTDTDAVTGSVTLSGRNPVALDYSNATGLLYVSQAEYADVTSAYGGIEVVTPDLLATQGIVIDDAALGGTAGPIDVSSDKGYVTSSAFDFDTGASLTKILSFNPDPAGEPALAQIYSSDGFIPDIAIDENGKLLVADWSTAVNGIAFVDPATGEADGETLATGASPSSITFIHQ